MTDILRDGEGVNGDGRRRRGKRTAIFTSTPETDAPTLLCPKCDGLLNYKETVISGVKPIERWDYFSLSRVRAVRVSRTHPHAETCDVRPARCARYLAEQSDATIFTDVTFSFVLAVIVEADAVLLELFMSAFASTVPVTSTLCPT